MTQTLVALYDDFQTARRVVEDLVAAGFDRESISMVANDVETGYSTYVGDRDTMAVDDDVKAGEGAGFGAVIGTLIGLGTALIPGIGPVIAAGPAAAALFAGLGAASGALTGGITAALVDFGVPETEAGYYAEGVRRGGTLVSINTADEQTSTARGIIERYNPVDVNTRGTAYQASGWAGYDQTASPYTADQIREERERYGSR